MDPTVTDRDFRLVELLDQALTELRAGRPLDTATWQGLAPDLAEDLPRLLETMRDLDSAAQTWRCGRTLAPEQTGAGTPSPEIPLPARIGRYEILGLLGAGGMGRVYKARDPQLDRTVAVKVPHFDGSPDSQAVRKARFLREARAAAAVVHHPHICPIHDVGEEGGLPYVVMAYIEGQSLAERLRTQGRYEDPRAAVDLALQVASALEAVHAHGIVHRDLKPANILLDGAGTSARLSDFGLARPGDSGEHLTVEGDVLGTPAYMAFEQATGQLDKVGPWTDLYSLGVVLYQMLTGRLPFEGPTTLGVLHKVTSETPPPPSRFRGDLDPVLDALVQRALARGPEDRYKTARAFADALQRWLSGAPEPTADAGAPPTATAGAAPTHVGVAAPTLTAGPEPAAGPKEQTVVLSGLPDGQALQLSLPAGAKADVKVTMTGGGEGKRTRKKRPWRVTVSISLSVAALLLAVGISIYVNTRPLSGTPDTPGQAQVAARNERDEPRNPLAVEKSEKKGNVAAVQKGLESLGKKEPPPPAPLTQTSPFNPVGPTRKGGKKGKPPAAKAINKAASREAAAQLTRGKALQERGQLDAAINAYRKAIALKPDFAQARHQLGVALTAKNRLDEAIREFQAALKINPKLPEAQARLNLALRDREMAQAALSGPLARTQNWAFNTAVIGKAPAEIPVSVFEYNPYPPVVLSLSPAQTVASSAAAEYAAPLARTDNPYPPGTVAVGGNPGTELAASTSSYSPYYLATPGGPGYGSAYVVSAQGQLSPNQEQARQLRQQVQQVRVETRRKLFDAVLYERRTMPNFTQREANIARLSLRRAQGSATPREVWSGRALNVLLKHLQKHRGQKLPGGAAALDEKTLKHLNVTAKGGSLWLLRDETRLNWPEALRRFFPEPELAGLENEARGLVQLASTNARPDPARLKDLGGKVRKLNDRLVREINEIPPSQYIQAKRFLNGFGDVLKALEQGEVAAGLEFRAKFAKGGKTLQELVGYLTEKGLRFAPALPGDEEAYDRVHRALFDWAAALEKRPGGNPPGQK